MADQAPLDSNLIPEEYRTRHGAMRRISSRLGLVIALLVFAASVAAYGGVAFYVSGLRAQAQELDDSIAAIQIDRNAQEERRIIALEKGLRVADTLLDDHRHWSAMLNRLEVLIVPSVHFESFTVQWSQESNQAEVSFDMIGPNYRALAEQMVSFQESSHIISVVFSDFTLNQDGEVRGSGTVHVAASIFDAALLPDENSNEGGGGESILPSS